MLFVDYVLFELVGLGKFINGFCFGMFIFLIGFVGFQLFSSSALQIFDLLLC